MDVNITHYTPIAMPGYVYGVCWEMDVMYGRKH